jgi:signal transduction histidine kinase
VSSCARWERVGGASWTHVVAALGRHRQTGWLVGTALVAAITGLIELLKAHTSVAGLGVLYLVAVLPAAIFWGTGVAFGISLLSAAALAIFSLDISQPADGVALAVFLVTALVVADLAARSRRAARVAERLADEQAALRRVATLVARGLPPTEIFAAVAEEVGRLIPVDGTRLLRYEPDGTATVIAGWSTSVEAPPELEVGARLTLEGESISRLVLRSKRPARIDNYASAAGPLSKPLHEAGVRSAAGAPIIVQGRLWGVITVGSTKPAPLPPGVELRLTDFTELVATAVANAESRSELAASRARIVAASDDARRRFERDLHDGAQQRLVTLGLSLRSAQAELPHDLEAVRAELSHVGQGLTAALEELREISRGIHPAILSEGGLAPALKTLARRSPIPVALDVSVEGRLPDRVEVAAYYVVSEMLTNTAKHAQASALYVDVSRVEEELHIAVRDDGVGGADPARGSGLVGLRDRVEALGGAIAFHSAKGIGTAVAAMLPLTLRGGGEND